MNKSVTWTGAQRTAAPRLSAAPAAALVYTRLAWRNLWRNWRRTGIALIAIVLGLLLLLFMEGMIQGSDQAIFGNAVRLYGGHLQIHAPGYRQKVGRRPLLPLPDAAAIVAAARTEPAVRMAAQRIHTGGLISSRAGSFPVGITGIEPDPEAPVSLQAETIVLGRFLLPEDGDAVLLGRGLADLLAVTVGDRVTLLGRSLHETMRQRTMTVVGIYDLGMPDAEKGMVLITLPEAQSLYGLPDQATEVTLVLHEMAAAPVLQRALQAAFPTLEVDTWETLRPEMRQTLDTKASVAGFFSFVVLVIAAIGVLNLMLMAAFERTREMGVLAALGLKGRQVMALFLLEGAFIGLVGAGIGCLLGVGLTLWVGQVGIDFSAAAGMGEMTALMGDRLYPSLSPAVAINRALAVAAIAALAALYPAWIASRQEPAQALHHV